MLGSLTTPIGKIFQPLLDAVGGILAFFYSIIPNYPIDVALLTIVIMALLTPLTVKSTKNMAAMQALGPEMKKLQQKYKGPENRVQLNEEMMKLYKEHNVNPASGCLPMLLQMPAFFILYSVIRGMTNTVTTTVYTTTLAGKKIAHSVVTADPRYIPKDSKMYENIVHAKGQLISFGMDFSDKLLSHHSSLFVAIPYLLLVVGAVGLQYLQMSRLNARNPGANQANPQAAMLQKYMPLIFGFIYLNVAAILNVYFIVSSAIRILTQEILFRKGIVGGPRPPTPATASVKQTGPKIPPADRTERALPKAKPGSGNGSAGGAANGKTGGGNGSGSNGRGRRTAPAAEGAIEVTASEKAVSKRTGAAPPSRSTRATGPSNGKSGTNGSNGSRRPPSGNGSTAKRTGRGSASNGSNRSNGSNGSTAEAHDDTPPAKEHPRSKAKRERKAR
jgi:YidC/Oxa1 family membrane protein insertase